jgi:putative endopeptidase
VRPFDAGAGASRWRVQSAVQGGGRGAARRGSRIAPITKHLALAATMLAAAAATQTGQPPAPLRAVDRTRLETTCAPCEDFYRFANGAWLDTVRIPPGRTDWGALPELRRRNQAFIADILDSLATAPERHARNVVERRVGTFHRTCLASTDPRADALAALRPELDRIASIRAPSELGPVVGRLQRHRVRAVFLASTGSDPTERVGIQVYAFFNAFSLPLSSYLGMDSTSTAARGAFASRVARMFEHLGERPEGARANALHVLAFETAMRRRLLPADSGYVWLPMSVVDDDGAAFNWAGFVSEFGTPEVSSLGVRPRTMPRVIDSLATTRPLEEWRAYLRWRLASAFAPALEARPGAGLGPAERRQRCAQTIDLLRDGVARAYVDRAFPSESRAAAVEMVNDVRRVLRERIAQQAWMSPATQRRAVAKLDSMRLWIGYPDQLDDLSGFEVDTGSFARNQLAARRHTTDRETALVGSPRDRDRWVTANVSVAEGTYLFQNALLITAAQLQHPFFDPRAEPAANLGKMGQVIGHELTHALGPEGRLHNEVGRREDWWTIEEVREFRRLAGIVERQYDDYVIVDSIRQNGRATLSENIADIGGVSLAWEAFTRAMRGQPRTLIDGFTPEQRFFIAYAQGINATVESEDLYRTQAQADQYGHSAAKWRVNGPLSSLPAFAAAFGCKRGDPMVRAETVRWTVW